MNLGLNPRSLVGLVGAAGSLIEVRSGRVWVTEPGLAGDRLLEPGRRYRVAGDGLVLVGTDLADGARAEIVLRPAWRRLRARIGGVMARLAARLRARSTACELEGLSDHLLRDIGLRREQIEAASTRPRVL